jgi:hypothetical protein
LVPKGLLRRPVQQILVKKMRLQSGTYH